MFRPHISFDNPSLDRIKLGEIHIQHDLDPADGVNPLLYIMNGDELIHSSLVLLGL